MRCLDCRTQMQHTEKDGKDVFSCTTCGYSKVETRFELTGGYGPTTASKRDAEPFRRPRKATQLAVEKKRAASPLYVGVDNSLIDASPISARGT